MGTIKSFSCSLLISALIHILPLLVMLAFSRQNKIENQKLIEVIFQAPSVHLRAPSRPRPYSSSNKAHNKIVENIHSIGSEQNNISEKNESNIFSFSSEVSQSIRGHLKISYPRIARERGLEGRVFLIAELTNQGKIKEIKVDRNKSTAHQILIDEVIQALHKGQIGPISSPEGIKTEIVIDFKLEN